MASHTPGAPVFAPPADLPEWAQRSVDLASPRLGARTLGASDDFFAEVARMLNPEPAQFVPGKYDTNGKWMDGWESRRKRVAGHYPAIDIEQSISRVMVDVVSKEQLTTARNFKQLYSRYQRNRDLINVGAYVSGSDRMLDEAIRLHPTMEAFLMQAMDESFDLDDTRQLLDSVLVS